VFKKRVLRRVFGPKRDKVRGKWRKLHNEELSDLYSLLNIVRVVKSRRTRRAGHVAHVGEGRTGFWLGNLRERDHGGDPEADGRIILRWILRKWEGVCEDWMELAQDRDRCRTLMSTAMNLRVRKMRGIS